MDVPGSWELNIKPDDGTPVPAVTPGRDACDALGDWCRKRLGGGSRAFELLGADLFSDMATS